MPFSDDASPGIADGSDVATHVLTPGKLEDLVSREQLIPATCAILAHLLLPTMRPCHTRPGASCARISPNGFELSGRAKFLVQSSSYPCETSPPAPSPALALRSSEGFNG